MAKQILKFIPVVLLLAIVPFLLPGGRLGTYYLTLTILSVSYAIACLGLTVVLGYSGQVSLAQAAFYGLGSYTLAILTVKHHWPFWPSALLGVIVPTLFGLFLGAISLRLTTHYLALVTIGFQVIISLVLNNWGTVTGGADGISNIPRPTIGPLSFVDDRNYYWLMLVFLCLAVYVVYRLRHSRLGNALLALREDEIAASSAGINLFWAKVLAFSMSAALGGLAGVLYAAGALYISPNIYIFDQSVLFFSMTLVGGQESIIGTILGAGLLTFLPEWLRFLKDYYIAVYGLLVIVVVLFLPEGLWGLVQRGVRATLRLMKKEKPVETAAVVETLVQRAGPVKRPQPSEQVLLEVKDLHKHFGGIKAVNGVSFTVRKGDVAVLIGPNGSGKTTVLNVLSGIYEPTSGEVWFDGRNISGLKPHVINRLGIARTFQNIRLFPELTALENVIVGYYPKGTVGLTGTLLSTPRGYLEERIARERAEETLRLLGFTRIHEKAKNLPYGQQRIVEIARAMVCQPQLLLLDEPAAGMNTEETKELSHLVYRLHELGFTILLIEHDMSFVSQVATQAYVMDFGSKIAEGSVDEVLRNPAVIKAYLGDDAEYDYA
ncbi:ABC transporter permease subunit [Alicyclobacillus macrosporangiidus]|uniref:branched-chain amino acid ABC transporter ATP-binding protein/permease n=1 Tax=Alicyclobacillus macrosporangiidus TaxID=392015 RepID=UPI00049855CB|nr:branched-chain amino acid ABC transporter ATP-binding protein/permease [Alicyclobacillus macrosporangiidus]